MATKASQLTRSIGSLVVLLALVVGVPVFLLAVAPSPLPSKVPAWDNITLAIEQSNIPSQVVINVIAVAAWIIWVQLAWSVAWELAVNARNLTRGHTLRPAPFVMPGIGSLVSNLVAGALAVSVITSATAAAAATIPTAASTSANFAAPAAVVLVIDDIETSDGVESPAAASTVDLGDTADPVAVGVVDAPRWVVASGDSMWSIAEQSLGDGSRVDEIISLNPQISSPRSIDAEMVLTLPADAHVPAANSVVEVAAPEAVGDVVVPAAEVTVAPGDHLWGISEDHIEDHQDGEASDSEIASYLSDVVDANPDIANPDLIHPGRRRRQRGRCWRRRARRLQRRRFTPGRADADTRDRRPALRDDRRG